MRYMTIIRKVLADLGCSIHYIDIAYAEKLRPKLILGKFSTDLVND
jgi:hypothetical protein